jgi:hypothetical protein
MFTTIGQLFGLISRTITAVDHLAEAGELQSQLILEASIDDVEAKRQAREVTRAKRLKLLEAA